MGVLLPAVLSNKLITTQIRNELLQYIFFAVCSSGTVYSQQNDAPMQHCAAHRAASPNPHNPQKFESPNYYLPLVDADLAQLPVHFLLNSEVG